MDQGALPPFDRPDEAGSHSLAQDWLAIWLSEMAALAVDREAREHWGMLLGLWASGIDAVLRVGARERPDGRLGTRTDAQARAAAADAASNASTAEIDRLCGRVAELEQRLAELERRPGRPARRHGPGKRARRQS